MNNTQKTLIKTFFLTIIIIISTPTVLSDLSCNILPTQDCSQEFTVLKLMSVDGSGYNNAHLELRDYDSPGYPYSLCCDVDGQAVELDCASEETIEILRLSDQTNAHVQFAQDFTTQTYNNPVCMGAGSEDDNCVATTDTCPEDYECLISIASSENNDGYGDLTNAHAAECGHYDMNICCYLDAGLDIPILLYPVDEDHLLTDRLPEFSWTNIDNPEGGYSDYKLEVSTNDEFTSTTIDETELNTNSFQVPSPMDFNTYYWRVKAYTQDRESEWSEVSTFTIVEEVNVVIEQDSINFGELQVGETYTTEDNTPEPFSFVNYGNVKSDASTITTSQSLWETETLGTSHWRIKARSDTSFNTGQSQTSWLNVGATMNDLIRELDFVGNNEVLVDILLDVPQFEPPGPKTSTLSFTWVSGE